MKKILKKFKGIWDTKFSSRFSHGVEEASVGAIFLLAMEDALVGVGEIILLPMAAGASAVSAMLASYKAYKKGTKNHAALLNAVASCTTALGIITSVILIFAGSAVLATVAPMVLTGALSFKALYDLGAGCYYWCQYLKLRKEDSYHANKCLVKARKHTVGFVVSALAAAATGAVFIADEESYGALGVVAAGIGMGYTSYEFYKAYSQHKKSKKMTHRNEVLEPLSLEQYEADFGLSNNASLHRTLSCQSNLKEENTKKEKFVPYLTSSPMKAPSLLNALEAEKSELLERSFKMR